MAGFELHGMLIHNNDDNSDHVIPSRATTPRLPASFNITLLSRLRLDYLFLFKREGRCAGVLIKRYVSISGGLSACTYICICTGKAVGGAQVAFFLNARAARKYFFAGHAFLFFKCALTDSCTSV